MPGIEKVVKDLEECTTASCCGFRTCPYRDEEWDIMRDALKLLKKKQPVKPIQFEKKSKVTRDKYECGACGSSEIYKEWDYCPYCGSPIDWAKDDIQK